MFCFLNFNNKYRIKIILNVHKNFISIACNNKFSPNYLLTLDIIIKLFNYFTFIEVDFFLSKKKKMKNI